MTSKSLHMQLRLRIPKNYIWSGLLYGCESWTIKFVVKKKMKAIKICFLRRMFKVPYIATRTNLAVLEMAGTLRQLMTSIRRRQLRHVGYTLRGTSLEKVCLPGVVQGIRAREEHRLKYMDGIKSLMRCRAAGEVVRLADDRGRCRQHRLRRHGTAVR